MLIYSGVCQCNPGIIGADCSVNASEPPVLIDIPADQICDTNQKNCSTIVVAGENFVNINTLTCHITEIEVCSFLLIL